MPLISKKQRKKSHDEMIEKTKLLLSFLENVEDSRAWRQRVDSLFDKISKLRDDVCSPTTMNEAIANAEDFVAAFKLSESKS